MQIKYFINDKGEVMDVKELVKREKTESKSFFRQVAKELSDTGKQFLKECEQGASDFGRELSGAKKKTRRK